MIQLLSIIVFLLIPLFSNSSVYADVVINELLPVTSPATLEWIELYNNGTESVSLDRWKLQNTNGDVKTFILNAGSIIAPKGFLTFSGAQTGISFSLSGDSVELYDVNNNKVDSQSFPSIIGFNNSIGRSTDGTGTWSPCTLATYNTANNCPQPSPTTTPIPTTSPIPTLTPVATEIPIPTMTPNQTISSLPTQQVVSPLITTQTNNPTPTQDSPNETSVTNYLLGGLIMFVTGAWGVIYGIAYLKRKKKNNSEE